MKYYTRYNGGIQTTKGYYAKTLPNNGRQHAYIRKEIT